MDPAASPAPDLPEHVDRALLDDTGRVAADVSCRRCRYNLRTLPATGQCPECAEPCAVSLRSRRLEGAPHGYLRVVIDGLEGLRLASILTALCLGVPCVAIAPMSLGLEVAFFEALGLLALVGLACGLAAVIAVVGGTLNIASRDPRHEDQHEGWTPRRAAIWALAVIVAALVGTLPAWALLGPTGLFAFGGLTVEIAFVALPVLLLDHTASLLARTSDARAGGTARAAAIVSYAFVALPVAAVVVLGLVMSWSSVDALVVFLITLGACYAATFAATARVLGRAAVIVAGCGTAMYAGCYDARSACPLTTAGDRDVVAVVKEGNA